jgi:hypothetical protein
MMKYRKGDPKKKKKAVVRGTKVEELPEGRVGNYDKTIFDYFKKKKK